MEEGKSENDAAQQEREINSRKEHTIGESGLNVGVKNTKVESGKNVE